MTDKDCQSIIFITLLTTVLVAQTVLVLHGAAWLGFACSIGLFFISVGIGVIPSRRLKIMARFFKVKQVIGHNPYSRGLDWVAFPAVFINGIASFCWLAAWIMGSTADAVKTATITGVVITVALAFAIIVAIRTMPYWLPK